MPFTKAHNIITAQQEGQEKILMDPLAGIAPDCLGILIRLFMASEGNIIINNFKKELNTVTIYGTL
jgi:hypothetical protein